MSFYFMYDEEIKKYLKDNGIGMINNKVLKDNEDELLTCKGIYFNELDDIIVNLNANQFKGIKEDGIIDFLTQTVTHEFIHSLVFNECQDKFTGEGEERVARLLAGQEILRDNKKEGESKNIQIETFKY